MLNPAIKNKFRANFERTRIQPIRQTWLLLTLNSQATLWTLTNIPFPTTPRPLRVEIYTLLNVEDNTKVFFGGIRQWRKD